MSWLSPDNIPAAEKRSPEETIQVLELLAKEFREIFKKLEVADETQKHKLTQRLDSAHSEFFDLDESLSDLYYYNEEQEWVITDPELRERRKAIDQTLAEVEDVLGIKY
tara:strand:- start:1171 stop:1497 length:327 start_codon:yes stop_codon:yes gene_type:complete